MIEDAKIGLKIAENKEELFWKEAEDRCRKAIFNAEKEKEINQHILKLCELRLEEISEQLEAVKRETIEDGS